MRERERDFADNRNWTTVLMLPIKKKEQSVVILVKYSSSIISAWGFINYKMIPIKLQNSPCKAEVS